MPGIYVTRVNRSGFMDVQALGGDRSGSSLGLLLIIRCVDRAAIEGQINQRATNQWSFVNSTSRHPGRVERSSLPSSLSLLLAGVKVRIMKISQSSRRESRVISSIDARLMIIGETFITDCIRWVIMNPLDRFNYSRLRV